MEVYKEILPFKNCLNVIRPQQQKVGLVPTMGALHEGHISLIKASKKENDITICSIFVNPVQFNKSHDLKQYPRSLESDLAKLKRAGCDVVFCPENGAMYTSKPKIYFGFDRLDSVMEGNFRPGHFSGVSLVVSKLFNIVNPDRAYFGQKDLQQYVIIQQLVKDLSFNVELRRVPIVREKDGLAMSSRNKRLSEEGRAKAAVLYGSLKEAERALKAGTDISEVRDIVKAFLRDATVKMEYMEVVDPETLNIFENDITVKTVAVCIAGYLEEVRLIDNVIFKLDF